MKTEYRVVFTATFDAAAERDKFYSAIKNRMSEFAISATIKRADMTKDEYSIPETQSTEKVI